MRGPAAALLALMCLEGGEVPSVPTRFLAPAETRCRRSGGTCRVVLNVVGCRPSTLSISNERLTGHRVCRLPPPEVMAPHDGFPLTPAGVLTAGTAVVNHAMEFSRRGRCRSGPPHEVWWVGPRACSAEPCFRVSSAVEGRGLPPCIRSRSSRIPLRRITEVSSTCSASQHHKC